MQKKKILWEIEAHTEAKHAILRKYLEAWIPIITRFNGRIWYIDGFAGPGEYANGEDGSPIIAIRAILNQRIRINAEVKMIFIEANKARCKHLQNKIDQVMKDAAKEPNVNAIVAIKCFHREFARILTHLFNLLDRHKKKLPPAFVFIDPFGFSGIPMRLIKRIMKNEKCEVLITFMYEEINRFISSKEVVHHFKEIFGLSDTTALDKGEKIKNPKEREIFWHHLYLEQLKNYAKIKYVRSFKMINKSNRTDYFLFFGTNNLAGLKKMKEAMWKVDTTGNFQFSDATYNHHQPTLFEDEPNYNQLKKILVNEFKNKISSIEEIERFILVETPFRETHYKKQILRPMEEQGEIIVERAGRKFTYPNDCKIKFL